MENIAGYKKLIIWQNADELAYKMYRITKSFPKDELFGLTSQLRRSALSVPTNIVEGYARNSKTEFKRFIVIALGSLAETKYLFSFGFRLEYITRQEFEVINQLMEKADNYSGNSINHYKRLTYHMSLITSNHLKNLYLPPADSHKGQNGRLLIIGGSHLFHAASLWALKVASRIVDLVHYSSVPENNQIVHDLKMEFRDGIVVPRSEVESYIEEDDVILIGPGMVRAEGERITNYELRITNLKEIEKIEDEGLQTAALTSYLFRKYPKKQWVIDAGALQMMDVTLIPKNAILTPHRREFEQLIKKNHESRIMNNGPEFKLSEKVKLFAKQHECIVLVKGPIDIASDGEEVYEIKGGNAGMTKGGTGDVLAGLIAALATKNDPLKATLAGSFINKRAGDELFKKVGPFFNASDLADEIPKVMKEILL